MREVLRIDEDVRQALAARRGVVALETGVVAHGLPWPENLDAVRRCAAAVREAGAVRAAVAVRAGVPVVGWRTSELPAFWAAESGLLLEHRVESAEKAAAMLEIHWDGPGRGGGVRLDANLALLEQSARVAGRVATALAGGEA